MSDRPDPSDNERRNHQRHPLGFDAALQTPNGSRFDITIGNYSNGGLFAEMRDDQPITTEPAAWELQEGDVVIARIPLQPGRSPRIVPARIARIEQTGFALRFNRDQPELVKALHKLGVPGGPKELSESGKPDSETPPPNDSSAPSPSSSPAQQRQLKPKLMQTTADYLGKRTDDFLDGAKDMMLVQASEAGSNVEQGRYFEAMGLLRKHTDAIKQSFIDRVNAHFNTLETLEFATEAGADAGELSLVDEEEFEDWLALSELKNYHEQLHRNALRGLELRLSQALSQRMDDRNQPSSPLALSQHFYESLKTIGFAPQVQRRLLELFGEKVLGPIDNLYSDLNDTLISAGILPTLPKEKKSQRSATQTTTQANDPAPKMDDTSAIESEGSVGPGSNSASADAISSAVSALNQVGASADLSEKVIDLRQIVEQLQRGGMPPAPPSPTSPVSMQDLNAAISELRELRAGESSQERSLTDALASVIKEQPNADANVGLGESQSDAVYLTEQLLQGIGEDTLATPQAKAWADQLELPILRMLLQDQSALQDEQHPARQLIDQLEQAAGDGSGSARDQQIIDQIDDIVHTMTTVDQVDQETFADAAGQINQLLTRRRRLRDTQLKRLVEACEGQYRLEQARNQVNDYLNQNLAGRDIPAVLRDLLDQGYRHLLELAQLRDDPERAEWAQRVDLLEGLRTRLEPDYQPQADDSENSMHMLDRLESALSQASVERVDRNQMLDRFKELMPGIGEAKSAQPKMVEFPTQPRTVPKQRDDSQLDPEHAMWLGRAQMLDVGSWLLYPGEDGKTRPIKLAWVSDDRERFVFVDRGGQKALEIGPDGLAEKLREQQADVVDQNDAPLVDRSWQNMVQRMHEQIAHQATHDQLTDVLNRKEFERQLRLKIGEAKLMHTVHGAFHLDLDQFNVLNANVGHEAGDQILRDVARLLGEALPNDAALARITGDAFAALVPKVKPNALVEQAEKLRAVVADHRIDWKEQQLHTTVSVGVVAIDQDTESVSQVLAAMEGACQAAKESGRDRIRSYETDQAEIGRRSKALLWVQAMEDGLAEGRLVLHAQKIAPVRDLSLPTEHYEVLSRLFDADGKPISPADFVPAAEAHGKVHLLDEHVLRNAFEMLANSPRYKAIDRLSLNISGKTFGRANFLDFVRDLFESTGVDPAKICFEITETAAVSNLAMCTDFLRQLRYLGCRFSLDDFGTGLSNFGYLKRLPVDYLKIDGSFVKEIATSTPDYGMVKTIHEIGNFLGKQTIAEYVENDQILEHLKDIGVDYAQGYGIAKPIPLEDVLADTS